MIDGLGIEYTERVDNAYYGLIASSSLPRKNIGEDAVEYLKKNVHPLDLAFRLGGGSWDRAAERRRLRGAGLVFAGSWPICPTKRMRKSSGVRSIARGYRDAFEASKGPQKSKQAAAR